MKAIRRCWARTCAYDRRDDRRRPGPGGGVPGPSARQQGPETAQSAPQANPRRAPHRPGRAALALCSKTKGEYHHAHENPTPGSSHAAIANPNPVPRSEADAFYPAEDTPSRKSSRPVAMRMQASGLSPIEHTTGPVETIEDQGMSRTPYPRATRHRRDRHAVAGHQQGRSGPRRQNVKPKLRPRGGALGNGPATPSQSPTR
jgi:hypothetical protein